jgi:hypothetical protein
MKPFLRMTAEVLGGIAAVLVAMAIGGLAGMALFVAGGFIAVLFILSLDISIFAAFRLALIGHVAAGAFLGVAILAAAWRSGELLDERGPF